jgi:fructokinase
MSDFRIGIDLGGTKVEIVALDEAGAEKLRRRIPAPKIYDVVISTLADLVREVEHEMGGIGTVGVGIPGCISPATGLVKNASSTGLIGHPFDRDLGAALNREVRVENDANCFALSEAADGAGAGAKTVFGVILGTGAGGGLVVDGQVIEGRNRIAGEWGHNPLPWARPDELPGRKCWCGQYGCLETMLSGTGLAVECDGPGAKDASTIPARAAAGEMRARHALEVHTDRLARALAQMVNILDPDVIVLGGGLSNLEHLYTEVPRLMPRHVFSDVFTTPVVRNIHGDSSGVRGAAWLWPLSRS